MTSIRLVRELAAFVADIIYISVLWVCVWWWWWAENNSVELGKGEAFLYTFLTAYSAAMWLFLVVNNVHVMRTIYKDALSTETSTWNNACCFVGLPFVRETTRSQSLQCLSRARLRCRKIVDKGEQATMSHCLSRTLLYSMESISVQQHPCALSAIEPRCVFWSSFHLQHMPEEA